MDDRVFIVFVKKIGDAYAGKSSVYSRIRRTFVELCTDFDS